MSNIFPETLAPNFFHVDKLPDYGLKLFENELGREIRRYTEDTGYKTELKIQYNGLRSDEVKALTAFYLQVKGTFDKFTLPINFYRSPSSITNSLTNLSDTTEWRFMNPPIIQTVISNIYTVEIRLLSLKDSLNPDSARIIGFVNSVNVDFILPTILIPQQTQVRELVPIALEFIASSIYLNQSVTATSINLTLETSELTFTTSTSGSVDSRSIQSLSLSFVASQTGFGILNSFEQMPSIIVSGTFPSLARYIHLVNTASGVASTILPSDAPDDTTIIYSDYAGTSTSSPTGFGLNAFTLNAPVGQTIQGQSRRVLNVENTSIQVIKKGNRWTIVGTELATGNSSGGSILVSDEGTQLTATATSLNFTGAGVTATNSGGAVTVNVTGGVIVNEPIAVVVASLTHLLTNPSFESPSILNNTFSVETVPGWGQCRIGRGDSGGFSPPVPFPNLSQIFIAQGGITLTSTPFPIPSNCGAIRFSFWHAPRRGFPYDRNIQAFINETVVLNFNPSSSGEWVKATTAWLAVNGGTNVTIQIVFTNLSAGDMTTFVDHVEVEGQFR